MSSIHITDAYEEGVGTRYDIIDMIEEHELETRDDDRKIFMRRKRR